MINILKESLWKQFGASIDMLKNAITVCPEDILHSNKKFFFITYHTLFFLDYYLTIPPKNLSSPLPFTIKEQEQIPEGAIDDIVPDRFYSKSELLDYLQVSCNKCHTLIKSLTEEKISERFIEEPEQGGRDYPILEILLYNMRHVQHHAAQLNIFLRQTINDSPTWVSSAKEDL